MRPRRLPNPFVRVILLGHAFALATAFAGAPPACPAADEPADDIREIHDAAGPLVSQLRLREGRLVEEVTLRYDSGGRPIERIENREGHLRVGRTVWSGDEVETTQCDEGGTTILRRTFEYADGQLVAMTEQTGKEPSVRTTFVYDGYDRAVRSEVRDANGRLLRSTLADYPPPVTPIVVKLQAGLSHQSDTRLTDMATGFSIHRKPKVIRYGTDPLEVAVDGTYRFNRAKGTTTTDELGARLAIDYNYLFPQTTIFTFTNIERNPPVNLKLNFEQALLGVKFDIVPRGVYQFDASFAPVWNFRSISSPSRPTDGSDPVLTDVSSSKLRGSLRVRLAYHGPAVTIANTFEFLPNLAPDGKTFRAAVSTESVLRDTTVIDVSLSRAFSLVEELKYTRDLSMRAQGSCPDDANPVCLGYAVATVTSLALKLDLAGCSGDCKD